MVLQQRACRYIAILACLFLVHLTETEEYVTQQPCAETENSFSLSSAESESMQDSHESRQRRDADFSDETPANTNKNGGINPRLSIPGLPDPATIIKIAQILQTVGEQVIPILIEGNEGLDLVGKRLGRGLHFLQNFKNDIDNFSQNLKNNKI